MGKRGPRAGGFIGVGTAVLLLLAGVVLDEAPDQRARAAARADYATSKERLEKRRRTLARRYGRAGWEGRKAVLAEARRTVLDAIWQDLFPAWYGTPWAYGGRTRTPGDGEIACGTFVATVLADAGFRLNRIRMGRLASEHIAKSLTGEANVRRYSNRPVSHIDRELLEWGPGLYVVGLDMHAGLIFVHPEYGARFVHSSYVGKSAVVSETLSGENPFAYSRYRVLAKLFDDQMMRRWIKGYRFKAQRFPPHRPR